MQAERLAPPDEDLERRRHHRHARAHARRAAEGVQQLVLPRRIGCDDHLVDVVTHAQRRDVLTPPEHRDPVERGAPRPVQAAGGDTHDVEPEPLLRADGRDHLGRRGIRPDHQHAAPGIAAEQRRAAEPPDQQEDGVEGREDDEDRAREHQVLAEEVDRDEDERLERGGGDDEHEVRARPEHRARLVEAEEVERGDLRHQHLRPVMADLREADRRQVSLRQRERHDHAQEEGQEVRETGREHVPGGQHGPANPPPPVAPVHAREISNACKCARRGHAV